MRFLVGLLTHYWPAADLGLLVGAAAAAERFWNIARGTPCERGAVPDDVLRDPTFEMWLLVFDGVRQPAEEALRRVDPGLTIGELLDLSPSPDGVIRWSVEE